MGVGLEEAAAHFAAAPFDAAWWDAALSGMGRAAGGWGGQLVVVSERRGFVLNLAPGAAMEHMQELESWGLDPADQPRTQVAAAPLMQVLADDDLIDPHARQRSDFYAFLKRCDASFCCISRVDQIEDLAVIACAHRTESTGHIQGAELETFAALLPHVRGAVRLQLALEDQGARLAVGMMEAVRAPALVCDGAGRLAAASPAGEARLAAGGALTVRGGRLYCPDPASNAELSAAIARAGVGPVAVGQPFPARCGCATPAQARGYASRWPPSLRRWRRSACAPASWC